VEISKSESCHGRAVTWTLRAKEATKSITEALLRLVRQRWSNRYAQACGYENSWH
jgi:hypothetical protein